MYPKSLLYVNDMLPFNPFHHIWLQSAYNFGKIVIPFISKVTQQILRIVSVTPSLTDSYTYQNILPPSHSHPTTLGDVMYEQPLCQTDRSLQSPLHRYCRCLVCGCLDTRKPINGCCAGKESLSRDSF